MRLPNQIPNIRLVQRSGRSHLTVIRTHIFRITSFPVLPQIIARIFQIAIPGFYPCHPWLNLPPTYTLDPCSMPKK